MKNEITIERFIREEVKFVNRLRSCFVFCTALLLLLPITADAQGTSENVADDFACEGITWAELFDVWARCEADPYHSTISFYSSMGCSNILCTNPAHTHWCPNGICDNQNHGHSAAEYAAEETYHPTCPCHTR
jgi:hypothetical protein